MVARTAEVAHQQHHQQQQQDQQQSSALLDSPQLKAALLGHHSVCQDSSLLLALLQSSKQLQAGAAAHCAGQLAVTVVLHEHPAVVARGFAAWLQRHAGLLRELHVELCCLGSDGSAVLQRLQEQQQQLQALQSLALDNKRSSYEDGLQDGWANSLLSHLPVGLRRLQLTGFGLVMQQDALAAFSRLQQLTQLTVGFSPFSALQHLRHLRSLDITDCWVESEDALAPFAGLQQLTELRLGKLQPQQLRGQLPPALQQLDVTLLADLGSQHHEQAAAWFKQHAGVVRRLVLDGECLQFRGEIDWKYVWGEDEAYNDTMAALEVVAEAFASVAAAAAAPPVPGTASTTTTTSSSSSRYPLQSLHVVNLPWLLDANAVRSLPASSLTELECSMNFSSGQELVAAISSLTALQALRIAYAGCPRYAIDDDPAIIEQPDSVLAPLSALQQLTQLQLPMVRAAQLAQLRLPRLQQLTATAGRIRHKSEEAVKLPQECPLELSQMTALTCLKIGSSTLLACDSLPGSLHAVDWKLLRPAWRAGPNADVASFSLQPLQQQQGLESLHLTFHDMRPDLCPSGLLHGLQDGYGRRYNDYKSDMWRLKESSAEQGIAGGSGLADAATVWGCMPLKSVRLAVGHDQGQYVFGRMPTSAVQALGALPLTELAIVGGVHMLIRLGLDITPAQLAKVVQRLLLLQHLQLEYFAMRCDESVVAATAAQQQQQGMQPYHSAAGVIAFISAAAGLPSLHKLQLWLPLMLQPAAAQQVKAVLRQQLPNLGKVRLQDTQTEMWPRND
jgi:hypothetical protein